MQGSHISGSMLLVILTCGVFGIINTEMGVVGIVPQIAAQFDVSIPAAGWTVSVFALVVALSAPVMPLICSRFNRRKVMIFVLSVFVVSNIVSFAASEFWQVLMARAVPALFHPVYVALAFTLAAYALPPERSAEAISKVFLGVSAGMVLGVPCTSCIAVQLSYEAAMLFFAVVNGAVLLATLRWIPDLPAVPQQLGAQLKVLKRPQLWYAFGFTLFLNGAVFGFFSFMSDFLNQVSSISFDFIAAALLGYSLSNIVGNLLAGRIYARRPRMLALLLPLILLFLYLTLYLSGRLQITAMILTLLIGIFAGMVGVVGQQMLTLAAWEAPEFANGLFLTAANAGTMLGTASCGVCISLAGTSAALWGTFSFLAVSIGFALLAVAARPCMVTGESLA